jgi:hypothetical protein
MLDKSAIICYSTPNYKPMTDIFLKSLKACNIRDTSIFHHLDTNIDPVIFNKEGFQTPLWYHCFIMKFKHIVSTLLWLQPYRNYKYYICTDCDIQYFNNKENWERLDKYISDSNKHIYYMREHTTAGVNGGLFIIRAEFLENILPFLQKVLTTMMETDIKDMPYADQTIVDSLKSTIRYGFIPLKYVIWGENIFDKKNALIHHCVCCYTMKEKLDQVDRVNAQLVEKCDIPLHEPVHTQPDIAPLPIITAQLPIITAPSKQVKKILRNRGVNLLFRNFKGRKGN